MEINKKILLAKDNLTYDKIIQSYRIILTRSSEITSITLSFINSLIKEGTITDFRLFTRTVISFAIYSKTIIFISTITPCPTIITSFSTEYWELITNTSLSMATLFVGAITFIKDTLHDYELENISEQLKKDFTAQMDGLRENSIPREIIEEERSAWKEIRDDLRSDVRVSEETNRKLSSQNTDLLESVKNFRTISNTTQGLQAVTVAGNVAFIAVQIFNAYNSYQNTGVTSTEDVKMLISSVNSLLSNIRQQNVSDTADSRAAESASANAPSQGLTQGHVDFTSEFGSE